MQILITGMHRSGTSMLARLVNLMGVYFGEANDSIGTNKENPLGFWERQDIRDLNDRVLHDSGADWNKVAHFDEADIKPDILARFENDAQQIIDNLDPHSPWLAKEPRTCLLLQTWKNVLQTPIIIFIYRNPLEVASSLNTRNGISMTEGIALWEKYNVGLFRAIGETPFIAVSHASLLTDPVTTVALVFQQLIEFGVTGIKLPSDDVISSFVSAKLYRERYKNTETNSFLNTQQSDLYQRMRSDIYNLVINAPEMSRGAISILENYQTNVGAIKSLQQECTELQSQRDEIHVLAEDVLRQTEDIFESSRWKLGDDIVTRFNKITLREPKEATCVKETQGFRARLVAMGERMDISKLSSDKRY